MAHTVDATSSIEIASTHAKQVQRGGRFEFGKNWNRFRGHDVIDRVGGYPFEYAAPDEIFSFYRERGFALTKLVCKGAGSGCVQYVFEKSGDR